MSAKAFLSNPYYIPFFVFLLFFLLIATLTNFPSSFSCTLLLLPSYFIIMRKFTIITVLALLCNASLFAQNQYEVLVERPNEKSYKGIITREILQADSSFKWYTQNQKGYTPNVVALNGLKKNADSIQLIVFMGTWCEDSQNIIPKFYSLLEAAGFSQDRVTLIGADRNKKTFSHLAEAMNIKNVPTIIVMKNGKETGRVIEYGKSGMFDKDLGEVLNTSSSK
jgi:thiol-disulfide isomerase/thioredoxin